MFTPFGDVEARSGKSRLISKFVDHYLRLDVKEEQTFQAEIDTMGMTQKEEIMQTMTSWEEKGMEKGMEKEWQSIALNTAIVNSDFDNGVSG